MAASKNPRVTVSLAKIASSMNRNSLETVGRIEQFIGQNPLIGEPLRNALAAIAFQLKGMEKGTDNQ